METLCCALHVAFTQVLPRMDFKKLDFTDPHHYNKKMKMHTNGGPSSPLSFVCWCSEFWAAAVKGAERGGEQVCQDGRVPHH